MHLISFLTLSMQYGVLFDPFEHSVDIFYGNYPLL